MLNRYYKTRLLLLFAAVISFVAFKWLGGLFGIPSAASGFGGSVLASSGGVLHLILIAIAICVLTLLCTFIVGTVRADAAVFCVGLGLTALLHRAGETRYTLFGQDGAGIWFTLAIELLLLAGAMGVAWAICHVMYDRQSRLTDEDAEFDDVGWDARLLSIGIHAFAMIALMSLLCRSDSRVQCALSVGLSAMLASMVTHLSSPLRPSLWYWISPIVVGVLGYVWASFSPGSLAIGQPGGYFASLARPLPLDYASTGIAGAMLGYWFARAWGRGDTVPETEPSEPALPAA